MSQAARQTDLQKQTQQLLDGPLKHIRAAALAAALLPLASVAAAPAAAQDCSSGGCGTVSGSVFNDLNSNGIHDGGDTPVQNAEVTICVMCDRSDDITGFTDNTGAFSIVDVPVGPHTVFVQVPTGTIPSPTGQGGDESADSDGVQNGGFSATQVNVEENGVSNADFGFAPSPAANPGTGTPGYWKNHREAWPVSTITIGGVPYSVDAAISWLGKVGKDKTTTMFSSLVPAILNVLIGNESSCVSETIAAAHTWMATHGPVGSNVPASSLAWKNGGEALHKTLDAYNNGLMCAPHRN